MIFPSTLRPSAIVLFVCAAITLCTSSSIPASQQSAAGQVQNHDPETAIISTRDVDLFWQAYDQWKTHANAAPEKLAAILDTEYLKKGSPGVQDFIPKRIVSGEALAKRILQDPKYYEDMRANTRRMESFVPEIRKGFKQLKEIYPDAVFPPVYFVIGRRTSGGTDSDRGLIIGAEMFSDDSRIHMDDVVSIVIHELIHYQQQAPGQDLTSAAMKEGAADFISELITGHHIDEATKPYGDSHEEALWNKFQEDARQNNFAPWLYNGGDKNRVGPPDLGYYMGYKICQSLYQISTDKVAALKTIVPMKDPQAIIAASKYAQRFGRPVPSAPSASGAKN